MTDNKTLRRLALLSLAVVFVSPKLTWSDTVKFVNGKELTNVRIVDETFTEIIVDLSEGLLMNFKKGSEVADFTRDSERARPALQEAPVLQQIVVYEGLKVSRELSRKLAQRIKIDYADAELEVIAKELSEAYGVKVEVDPAIYAKSGPESPLQVSIRGDGIRLVAVLKQLAKQKGLSLRGSESGDAVVLKLPER